MEDNNRKKNINETARKIISISIFLLVFFILLIILSAFSDLTFWKAFKTESGFAETIAIVLTGIWEVSFWGIEKMILAGRERKRLYDEFDRDKEAFRKEKEAFRKEKEEFYRNFEDKRLTQERESKYT